MGVYSICVTVGILNDISVLVQVEDIGPAQLLTLRIH
jgi:hypothetical protein